MKIVFRFFSNTITITNNRPITKKAKTAQKTTTKKKKKGDTM